MSEQGVFNRKYDWYFFDSDGDAVSHLSGDLGNIPTDLAWAKIDNSAKRIIANRISVWGETTNYYQTELYRNALRFYYKAQTTGGISKYTDDFDAKFAIGMLASYNVIATDPTVPICFGTLSEIAGDYASISTTTKAKVAVNKTSAVHEFDVSGGISTDDALYFTTSGTDNIRVVKRDAGSSIYTLDFYIY